MRFSQMEFSMAEAWKGFIRGGLMSFIAVFTITLIMVIFGYFMLLLFNIHSLTDEMGSQLEISVYLKDQAEAKQVDTLMLDLKSQSGVEKLEFISKADAWAKFQKDFSGINFESLSQDNPLPDTIKVRVKHLYQIPLLSSQLKNHALVQDLQTGGEIADKLHKFAQFINIAGLILISILVVFTLFLVVNTIQMTVLARKNEIEIMQLVGATHSMIQIPFIIEGLLMGFISASLASLVVKISYSILLYRLHLELPFFPILLQPVEANAIFLSIFLLGLFLGGLGGWISVNRSLQ